MKFFRFLPLYWQSKIKKGAFFLLLWAILGYFQPILVYFVCWETQYFFKFLMLLWIWWSLNKKIKCRVTLSTGDKLGCILSILEHVPQVSANHLVISYEFLLVTFVFWKMKQCQSGKVSFQYMKNFIIVIFFVLSCKERGSNKKGGGSG